MLFSGCGGWGTVLSHADMDKTKWMTTGTLKSDTEGTVFIV